MIRKLVFASMLAVLAVMGLAGVRADDNAPATITVEVPADAFSSPTSAAAPSLSLTSISRPGG